MKSRKIKNRTMPVNNLIMRGKSLFATKQEPQPNNQGWGWSRRVLPHEKDYAPFHLTLASRQKFGRQTSRIFDYLISVGYANINMKYKELNKDDPDTFPSKMDMSTAFAGESFEVEFKVADYLKEANILVNRKAVADATKELEKLIGTTIKLKIDGSSEMVMFSLLSGMKVIGNGVESVIQASIPTTYYSSMDKMMKRRIQNLSKALPLKSLKAREMWKFIQSRSQGVSTADGETKQTVKEFYLTDAAQFLDIRDMDTTKREIRRALKELDLNYKLVDRNGLYIYLNQNIKYA